MCVWLKISNYILHRSNLKNPTFGRTRFGCNIEYSAFDANRCDANRIPIMHSIPSQCLNNGLKTLLCVVVRQNLNGSDIKLGWVGGFRQQSEQDDKDTIARFGCRIFDIRQAADRMSKMRNPKKRASDVEYSAEANIGSVIESFYIPLIIVHCDQMTDRRGDAVFIILFRLLSKTADRRPTQACCRCRWGFAERQRTGVLSGHCRYIEKVCCAILECGWHRNGYFQSLDL